MRGIFAYQMNVHCVWGRDKESRIHFHFHFDFNSAHSSHNSKRNGKSNEPFLLGKKGIWIRWMAKTRINMHVCASFRDKITQIFW